MIRGETDWALELARQTVAAQHASTKSDHNANPAKKQALACTLPIGRVAQPWLYNHVLLAHMQGQRTPHTADQVARASFDMAEKSALPPQGPNSPAGAVHASPSACQPLGHPLKFTTQALHGHDALHFTAIDSFCSAVMVTKTASAQDTACSGGLHNPSPRADHPPGHPS